MRLAEVGQITPDIAMGIIRETYRHIFEDHGVDEARFFVFFDEDFKVVDAHEERDQKGRIGLHQFETLLIMRDIMYDSSHMKSFVRMDHWAQNTYPTGKERLEGGTILSLLAVLSNISPVSPISANLLLLGTPCDA